MFDADFVNRFERKFEKGGEDDCWLWRASVAGRGYGQIKLPKQRKQEYAHRVSYLVYRGEITEGWFVCHHCDTPRCVNPKHLFLGTCKDNLQDMARKGRSTKGIKNSRSRLTEEQVRQIKSCLAAGMKQTQIASAFNISQIEISRINTGQRWKHIT